MLHVNSMVTILKIPIEGIQNKMRKETKYSTTKKSMKHKESEREKKGQKSYKTERKQLTK